MVSVDVHDDFYVLAAAKSNADLLELRAMSVEQLRALWDSFDADSFCGKYDCALAPMSLNYEAKQL